ncbi:hypothetical protein ACF3OE_03630 [Capnocytophaga canis]|uniref:hypothetical protein n=1 Tax=Capnocytophaga canis TaxID=1848903 RepID=UPI00370D4338
MAGGKITRIVASVNRIECDSWNVYTDEFNASSGGKSVFTADEGTHFGTPKELPPARKYFVKGWWTDKNDKPIKEAHIGDTIRFHIETKGIGDGEKVVFTVYDWDFLDILNDKLTLSDRGSGKEITTITIHNNKGFIEWTTGEQCLKLLDEILEGDEIELFVECRYKDETINLPYMESDYLILKEKEEIITVLIELPHSSYTDKLNRKGLGGHTGIIIGEEYYDYGPQANQGENLYSEGRPWWDKMNQVGNLTKKDIINILNREFPTQQEIDDIIKYYKNTGRLRNFPTTNRYSLGIIGRVCLIDIHIKGSEKNRIQKWWEDKYQNLGHYSVWILFGEQCTTTVRISIEESTEVFSTFDITSTTQSPQGFLGLLTEDGEHTYSSKKGNKLTINKEYREIPYIEISNFESGYNQQLSS